MENPLFTTPAEKINVRYPPGMIEVVLIKDGTRRSIFIPPPLTKEVLKDIRKQCDSYEIKGGPPVVK